MKHSLNSFHARCTLFFMLFCSLYFIIILNLYRIQIHDHEFFTQLGSHQYTIQVSKPPLRAPIMDRHCTYLAINHDCISAFILPNKLTNPDAITSFLAEHFPEALSQLALRKNKQFMYVQRKLSPEQIALINNAHLQDIQLLHESNRFYPIPCTAPLVGKTDIDNNGILGIELSYNTLLSGTPTSTSLQKDARSGYFYFTKETTKTGQSGQPIQLTIDSDLQFLVHEELKAAVTKLNAHHGSALIMDPATGEILCMATWPHFDPNKNNIESLELTKNRIITDAYELGSVIKVFAALAALEEKVVTPEELINCKNTKTTILNGRTINTWKEHGLIPFADVIALSNNIGIAIVAKRVGEALFDHYSANGFGKKTGIQLPGEHRGIVTHPSNWSKQSIISLSYGYEIAATLLQLGTAFCTIARNGYVVKPTIILDSSDTKISNTQNTYTAPQLYSDTTSATIKQILERTTQEGTAKHARIQGYRIMSKTGTANQLVNGIYDQHKNIFTCAGIIEKGDYQRVVVTFIKETDRKNAYASTIAAPLFEKITKKMLIHDRVI